MVKPFLLATWYLKTHFQSFSIHALSIRSFYILHSLLDLYFLAGDLNLDWLNSVSAALTPIHSLPSGFLPRRPYVLLQSNHHVRYRELTIVMWQ